MDCQQCSNNLTAFLDGELLSSFEQEVESHLEACAKCAQELRELEASAEFIDANAHDLELKPDLWNNLRVRISPMPIPLRGGLLGLWARNRWFTAAAAVAATAVLAFGLAAYVDYVERQEIQQYMSDYIREREEGVTEIRTNVKESDETEAPEFIELANPFATTRPVSLQNPFR